MNSQKVRVYYKDLIENIEQLQVAIRLTFESLPQNHEIIVENSQGIKIDNEQIIKLKLSRDRYTRLYIKQIKDEDLDIESLSSDLSKISILENRAANENQLVKQNLSLNHSIREQSKLKFEKQQSFERRQQWKQKDHEKSFDQKEKIEQVLNEDVQCNGCFSFPIKGIIYKCLVCYDYDLCSKCEISMHHFHPLLKVTKREHYPTKVKVVFSKNSKVKMEKLAEIDKINEEKRKKLKYQKQIPDYKIVDPSTLESQVICKKNFLSEIIGSID